MKKEIEELFIKGIAKLKNYDCGDHSCYFAKDKSGMRTNGGCRCLSNLPSQLRLAIISIYRDL
jgi:hypothetical protein